MPTIPMTINAKKKVTHSDNLNYQLPSAVVGFFVVFGEAGWFWGQFKCVELNPAPNLVSYLWCARQTPSIM